MAQRRQWLMAACLLAAPSPAFAWGREGHAVIAAIAQAHLTPAAYSATSLLLEEEGLTQLAEVASWADDIRRARPETAPWHYVDIPLGAPGYVPARDCAGGDCAIAKLDQFRTVLADPQAPAADRLEALKWIVHLVGDLHQPLHAEDNNDKGGNQITVTGFDRRESLHAIWDTAMIEAQNPDADSLADMLDTHITKADIAAWDQGSSADWALQTHQLAVPAYALLGTPPAGSTVDVPDSYITAEQPVIDGQLERAGIRLAYVLNQALK